MGASPKERQATGDASAAKPRLVFFYSPTSGRCRRTEGYLAHMLQRRHNHEAFEVVRVNVEERPDLARRFRIEVVPTLVVVVERQLVHRIVSPRSAAELERELAAWLR